jgi:hypothetical protein
MRMTFSGLVAITFVFQAGAALAAADPADKCEASKNKTAGAYYSCREKAESKAITKALPADYSKCTATFDDKWDGAETTGAGACPDTVMTAPMNAFIAAQAADAALVIAGAPIPDCAGDLSICEGDLAACEAAPVCGDGLIGAGEECDVENLSGATCATQGFAGGTLACATGCTFDESDCYATRFDASGATIIDLQTGLEWEKKTGTAGDYNVCPGGPTCGSVHDVNNAYSWGSVSPPYAPSGNAYIDFLAKLNSDDGSSGCYAGHCDWRLPTIEELQGIVDLSAAGCGSGSPCLGTGFLPDAASYYWSASTYATFPYYAWLLFTDNGGADFYYKTDVNYVRAVRSGS